MQYSEPGANSRRGSFISLLRERVFTLPALFFFFTLFIAAIEYSTVVLMHFEFYDIELIVDNPYLRDFSHITTILSSGRPVRGLTFMIDYALWGLSPRGFHITNVILHLLCTYSLFFLLVTLFKNRRLAAMAALLFEAHPVQSEAVIGIAHRKELLAMLFFCLTYLCYLRYGRKLWGYGLSLLLFILALGSKQVTIVLPILIAAQEWFFPYSSRPLKKRILPLGGFLLLVLLPFILVMGDYRLFGHFRPREFFSPLYMQIISTSFSAFPAYLRMFLAPVHLCVDPALPIAHTIFEPRALLGILIFIGCIAFALFFRKRWAIVGFGMAWFVLNIIPVMNFVPPNSFLAERYIYIPSAGLCLLLAALLERLAAAAEPAVPGKMFTPVRAVILYVLALQGILHPIRMSMRWLWLSDIPYLFSREYAVLYVGLMTSALFTLAVLIYERITADKRRRAIRAGLDIAFIGVLLILSYLVSLVAIEYILTGRMGLPDQSYNANMALWDDFVKRTARPGVVRKSIIHPTGSELIYILDLIVYQVLLDASYIALVLNLARGLKRRSHNLALAFMLFVTLVTAMMVHGVYRSEDWGFPVSLWKATVRENPKSFAGWNNLGRAYMDRRFWPMAEDAFQKALTLKPDNTDVVRNLAFARLYQGDLKGATRYLEAVVEKNPADVNAILNLGNCYASEGEYRRAIDKYFDVLRLDPGSATAQYNMAYCFHALGDLRQALMHLKEALTIYPEYPDARQLKAQITEELAKEKQAAGQ